MGVRSFCKMEVDKGSTTRNSKDEPLGAVCDNAGDLHYRNKFKAPRNLTSFGVQLVLCHGRLALT